MLLRVLCLLQAITLVLVLLSGHVILSAIANLPHAAMPERHEQQADSAGARLEKQGAELIAMSLPPEEVEQAALICIPAVEHALVAAGGAGVDPLCTALIEVAHRNARKRAAEEPAISCTQH